MDLQSLKLALDTNNPDLFHGDWTTALAEVVDRLIGHEDEVDDEIEALESAKNEFEDSIVETLTGCTCVDDGNDEYTISNNEGKLTLISDDLFEGGDYEIIVRVIR